MHRFTMLVAAVLSALPTTAVAQPRGRAQAADASAPVDEDGPEARGVASFKLDDIIEVAVRLSPDIARARTNRDAGRESAEAAGRGQAWILSASINGQVNSVGGDGAELEPLAVIGDKKIDASISIGRNLPTGGNVEAQVGLSHDERELNVTGDVLAQAQAQGGGNCGQTIDIFCTNQALAKLTFKQPLGRGLGSEVALAQGRKANLTAVETTIKAQLAAEQLIQEVVAQYWDLAYAGYEVDVRAEALQAARDQESLTRQEMRAGTASQNQLDAVAVEIALRDEALLTAKLTFEQKSLDLRRKVGLEIGRRDIVVRPADPLEIDEADWDIDDILARSHKTNRQLASLVVEQKIADVEVDVAHDLTKPQLDLSLSGGLTGTGNTAAAAFGGTDTAGNSGVGYQVMAGLSMSFELSGAARAGERAALAKRHLTEIERIDAERTNDAQIVGAVKTLMSGKTRVALADKAIRLAGENLKAARANFLAGRSTNFEVMQRQQQVLESELRRGKAVADYRTAVVKLQFLAGTLLDAYRIHVRGA
jgi:outer membrane protein TolC